MADVTQHTPAGRYDGVPGFLLGSSMYATSTSAPPESLRKAPTFLSPANAMSGPTNCNVEQESNVCANKFFFSN